jgi:hypothetical protein
MLLQVLKLGGMFEVDLGAAGGDDCAVTDDESAVGLRARLVGRERYGLSSCYARKTQPHQQQAGERTQKTDPRISPRKFSQYVRAPPWIFFI